MKRYPKRFWLLATALAVLAGYVDAAGFLMLGGFFVSFMSGNSTRLAVGLAQGSAAALLAGGLVASFLAGVVAGAVLSALAGAVRKPAVLALVAVLLGSAALLAGAAPRTGAAFVMAAAMGAANCVFQQRGEVSVGVTYMTGTLVKLGQHLAATLLGRERFGWLPHLLLWSGLVTGAVLGAALFPLAGTLSLWIASSLAAALAVVAWCLGPAELVG